MRGEQVEISLARAGGASLLSSKARTSPKRWITVFGLVAMSGGLQVLIESVGSA